MARKKTEGPCVEELLPAKPLPTVVSGAEGHFYMHRSDVREVASEMTWKRPGRLFDLIVADFPWPYDNTGGDSPHFRGTAKSMYQTLSLAEIRAVYGKLHGLCRPGGYLINWVTHPLLRAWHWELARAFYEQGWEDPWHDCGGGSWHKARAGTGFHARGQSELIETLSSTAEGAEALLEESRPYELLGKKDKGRSPRPQRRGGFSNALTSHAVIGRGFSRTAKPRPAVERHIQAFAPPGGWILDVCGGSCTYGEVAMELGRHYVVVDLFIDSEGVHDPLLQAQARERMERAWQSRKLTLAGQCERPLPGVLLGDELCVG